MIALDSTRHERLAALVDAGSDGLPVGSIGIGTALYLALHGLARVEDGQQRVWATPAARGFMQRRAWA